MLYKKKSIKLLPIWGKNTHNDLAQGHPASPHSRLWSLHASKIEELASKGSSKRDVCGGFLNGQYLRHAKDTNAKRRRTDQGDSNRGRSQKSRGEGAELSWVYMYDLGCPVNGLWFLKAVFSIAVI